jgi:hypothetical protein
LISRQRIILFLRFPVLRLKLIKCITVEMGMEEFFPPHFVFPEQHARSPRAVFIISYIVFFCN